MTSKGIRHVATCLFALTLFTVFVITPVSAYLQENGDNNQILVVPETDSPSASILFNILQDENDTTDTTDTSETTEDEFSGWTPFIDEGL
ncbi:MAG: hypothetical protein ACXABG_13795, partial [Promethearchaeota archaeon]